MSPLVVVIINKDEGFIRWHHMPAFSPAPKSGRNKHVFARHLKIGQFRRIWSTPSNLRSAVAKLCIKSPHWLHHNLLLLLLFGGIKISEPSSCTWIPIWSWVMYKNNYFKFAIFCPFHFRRTVPSCMPYLNSVTRPFLKYSELWTASPPKSITWKKPRRDREGIKERILEKAYLARWSLPIILCIDSFSKVV